MKKILLYSAVIFCGSLSAQNLTDALKFSKEDFNGTARYRAMSGAFGALGGDLSAVGLNPAGNAVISGSEISFSFGNDTNKQNISLANQTNNSNNDDFSINQFAFAFVIPNSTNSLWKKFSLGLNYSKSRNYELDNATYYGVADKGLDAYFHYFTSQFELGTFDGGDFNIAQQADITNFYRNLGDFNAQKGYLGLISEIVVPSNLLPNNTDYEVNSNYVVRKQKYEVETLGENSKYNFNFSTQYGDHIYLGLNLNSHSIRNRTLYSLREDNFEAGSDQYYANHQQITTTKGSGFSFQFGAIAKIENNWRLGVSYHSPTWYSLEEEYQEVLYSELWDIANPPNRYNRDIELTNSYGEPLIDVREYKFRTSGSWLGSVAYLFGKSGLISLDYIYKGYGKTTFTSDNLKPENDIIQNELGDTSAIRIGGEYRIKAFSLRAGYRWEQSPYKNKFISDLNGYSFGAGYSFGGFRVDVSYDIAKQNSNFRMYETAITTPALIKQTRNNLIFTLSAKLF